MADWYRQKAWSTEIEEFYFSKLKKSRDKAQYLKIQAIELVETKQPQLLDVAEMLLNKLFTDFPENRFDRSSSLVTMGKIYDLRGNPDKALAYYKQAMEFEKVYPQVKTQAYSYFAELVIKANKTELFDIVENAISDRMAATLFPIEKYKGYSILAIINSHNGNLVKAKEYAALAEENAKATTSGLRYHQYLGIVKEEDKWLDRLISKIKK